MQLLDSEQLEYAFQLHGITLEVQARQFYTDLWATIQAAEKARDQAEILSHERTLRHLCQSYFELMRGWSQSEEDRHEHADCCALSRDNARESSAALPAFEKQFFRYALCYLELNRALIQARLRISSLAKEYNLDDSSNMMDVNHGTGAILSRAHKGRHALMEKRLRIERVKTLLQSSDPMMEQLGADLPRLYGPEGDRQLTLFKGALRKSDFEKAENLALSWKNDRVRANGRMIAGIMRQNADILRAQEGLILHSGELSLISAFLKGDEERANEFVEKYNVPYMIFQYRNLIHQGYLLGRIGSIEGLIVQHVKLVSLAARPHDDMDYAKAQEQAVLLPVRSLLQSKFATLGAIFNDMETILHILDKLFVQSREYRANTPIKS